MGLNNTKKVINYSKHKHMCSVETVTRVRRQYTKSHKTLTGSRATYQDVKYHHY